MSEQTSSGMGSAPDRRFARRAAVLGKSVFDHAPGAIILSSGLAYPPMLPDVVREAGEALGPHIAEGMQYGPLMGLDDLRDQICRFVAEDGVRCSRDEVLVTYGAKSALDLACRVFIEPGDRMIVTRPTYMTAIHIMRTHNVSFLTVGQDEEGLDTDELEDKLKRLEANGENMPKLLFDIPDFHNPTGITMSLPRRKALIGLAERWNFLILEDDPYRRLRFDGDAVPPLKALDPSGVVIALGTVSKILAPGLRVGWAIGAADIVRRMAMQKADGGSNPFAQRIVAQLMQSNQMGRHVDELATQMRLHRDTMIDSFAEHLPDATIRRPAGGYFLWAELPDGVDAERVVERGVEHGVEASTGRLCFPEDAPGNFLRLAYSFPPVEQIKNGVARLGAAYAEYKSAA